MLLILLKIRVAAGFPVYSEASFTGFSVTALLGNLQSNLLLACWTVRFLRLPTYCHLVGDRCTSGLSRSPMGCAVCLLCSSPTSSSGVETERREAKHLRLGFSVPGGGTFCSGLRNAASSLARWLWAGTWRS